MTPVLSLRASLTLSIAIVVSGFAGAGLEASHLVDFGASSVIGTLILVASTILLHELGHLAACYRSVGIVGSISFFFDRGFGGLCADISAATRAGGETLARIYLAGPALQLLASAFLLIVPTPPFRMAGVISLVLSLINLIPFP